jgi:hypothetical protein
VRLSKLGEGFVIDHIALTTQAKVPSIGDAKFQEIASAAKSDCPLSKALASIPEITLRATLRRVTGALPTDQEHAVSVGCVRDCRRSRNRCAARQLLFSPFDLRASRAI